LVCFLTIIHYPTGKDENKIAQWKKKKKQLKEKEKNTTIILVSLPDKTK